MTYALTIRDGPTPQYAALDGGVSDDAHRMRGLVLDAIGFAGSIALGDRKTRMLEAVTLAARRASVENWDGRGAAAVPAAVVDQARRFVRMLPLSAPVAEVEADSDGEISFDWDLGARRLLSVSVKGDGTLGFASLVGHNRVFGYVQMVDHIPADVRQHLYSVITGTA